MNTTPKTHDKNGNVIPGWWKSIYPDLGKTHDAVTTLHDRIGDTIPYGLLWQIPLSDHESLQTPADGIRWYNNYIERCNLSTSMAYSTNLHR